MTTFKNQTSVILDSLIRQKYISERDFNYNGFRARLSELRRQIPIESQQINYVNEFGHPSYYKQYSISKENKTLAKKLFKHINK
jgi:hypothetical protein